jgi:hypothetical protein
MVIDATRLIEEGDCKKSVGLLYNDTENNVIV